MSEPHSMMVGPSTGKPRRYVELPEDLKHELLAQMMTVKAELSTKAADLRKTSDMHKAKHGSMQASSRSGLEANSCADVYNAHKEMFNVYCAYRDGALYRTAEGGLTHATRVPFVPAVPLTVTGYWLDHSTFAMYASVSYLFEDASMGEFTTPVPWFARELAAAKRWLIDREAAAVVAFSRVGSSRDLSTLSTEDYAAIRQHEVARARYAAAKKKFGGIVGISDK